MKKLRLARFEPNTNAVTRYWEEDGFRRNDTLNVADLTAMQQAVVAAALAWAVAQLPSGFETLQKVELERLPDVVTEWSTPVDPEEAPAALATSAAFAAAITGSGDKGQATAPINSVPGPETDGLAGLWDSLSV